jgi:N-carbamoyl-L-amino-acid hydrolase
MANATPASIRTVVADLDHLASISGPGPGVNRLAFTSQDVAAREWFRARCDQMGLRFECDPVGNCFGWSAGSRQRPAVLLGSHLDSVFDAGRYDGTTGVVVGFEVAFRLLARDPGFPVAVVSFACEESTRFGMGTVGSRFLLGELLPEDLGRLEDRDGATLQSLLQAAGLGRGERLALDDPFIDSFIEVHVDQGPWLTGIGARVAVVTYITGVQRLGMRWLGEASHSGAQSHARRRDALLGAADFTLQADALWQEIDAIDTRSVAITVGQLNVVPNSPNTVPGEVQLIVDVRSADPASLDRAVRAVSELAHRVAAAHHLELMTSMVGNSRPLQMDGRLRAALKEAAGRVGVQLPDVVSLSGHDAMVIGRRFPAAMLLVANPTGLSHSPDESIDEVGLAQAVEVLVNALPELASKRPSD